MPLTTSDLSDLEMFSRAIAKVRWDRFCLEALPGLKRFTERDLWAIAGMVSCGEIAASSSDIGVQIERGQIIAGFALAMRNEPKDQNQ